MKTHPPSSKSTKGWLSRKPRFSASSGARVRERGKVPVTEKLIVNVTPFETRVAQLENGLVGPHSLVQVRDRVIAHRLQHRRFDPRRRSHEPHGFLRELAEHLVETFFTDGQERVELVHA